LVPCQPFGRRDIPSERPTAHSIIRPDLPLCREVSNCSSLHLSGRFSNPSGRLSVFDQASGFLSKHRYEKIAATVQTMWIPVRTRSSIRQVSQFKSRRPDDRQHGPNARTSNMEIACIWSIVRTTIPLVRTREAFIWKLLVADVRPSRWQGNTVRTRVSNRKDFSEIFRISVAQLSVWTTHDYRSDSAKLYQARRSFESLTYK